MLKLGHSKEEIIARNVVDKLQRVIETESYGEEIAVRSATDIVSRLRKDNSGGIADEVERQLAARFPKMKWAFPPKE